MSFVALAWAAKQRPGNLAAKMVLLGLANYADEHGCSYPSTAAIAEFGDMDHKTATAAIDKLAALNLIEDSGERAGRTKQIKVYRLALESLPKTEAYQKRKPSVFPPKDPQKRGTDTVREPVPKKDKPSLDKRPRAQFPPPRNVPSEVWADFLASPKRRKAGMSDTAYAGICRNLVTLAEHGFPPGEMIALAVERGWVTVKLEWAQNERGTANRGDRGRVGGPRADPTLQLVRAANAAIARGSGNHGESRLALPPGQHG